MHPSTISKWFVKFVKECGLPEISFHGLRHTNATLLISQNIDVAVVAARLGHAQISTTFNFYVHPVISHNKVAGNVLENLLIPGKNTENPNWDFYRYIKYFTDYLSSLFPQDFPKRHFLG